MSRARTGRPSEGQSAKLAPLNMRTSPQLRAQIEKAADANGRSLTQEVEYRLRRSFQVDDLLAVIPSLVIGQDAP